MSPRKQTPRDLWTAPYRRRKNHNESKPGMFSPGRELFSFSKEPIFRLTARLVERHASALAAPHGRHGNRTAATSLHFGHPPPPPLLAPREGDAVHRFEAPFWSPPNSGRLSTNLYFNRTRSLALRPAPGLKTSAPLARAAPLFIRLQSFGRARRCALCVSQARTFHF
ncbi:uncharacterized protein CEXT_467051 [Caerostris extrusa]|uniref:Uncharacterized protein n=1 Tax=Caerostris extrusa TaxID=172846 RepID=A0AAV4ULI8_CAEEX|nr:uncharacterized protein CEXT_467051 [Caerostris extrusa]